MEVTQWKGRTILGSQGKLVRRRSPRLKVALGSTSWWKHGNLFLSSCLTKITRPLARITVRCPSWGPGLLSTRRGNLLRMAWSSIVWLVWLVRMEEHPGWRRHRWLHHYVSHQDFKTHDSVLYCTFSGWLFSDLTGDWIGSRKIFWPKMADWLMFF